MKKLLLSILCLTLLLSVTACSDYYVSGYKAVMFVRTENGDHGSIRFSSFEGTYVMKLKMKELLQKVVFLLLLREWFKVSQKLHYLTQVS